MGAAGGRALRVSRQRASSRAFELAAPVWEAAAASYGYALRVRWAGLGGFVPQPSIRGEAAEASPNRAPSSGRSIRRQGPAGAKVKRFGLGASARDAKSTANCSFDCQKPTCSRPGAPTA